MRGRPGIRPLLPARRIRARVRELAAEIDRDYAGREVAIVGVLNGCFVFLSDLVRQMETPSTLDFVSVSSYGAGTASSGRVTVLKDVDIPLAGRDVLIVEDILDSGRTLAFLQRLLAGRGCASVRTCVLLRKPGRPVEDLSLDYCGFDIGDEFVVGYGLDLAGRYRDLPFVGVLEQGEAGPQDSNGNQSKDC